MHQQVGISSIVVQVDALPTYSIHTLNVKPGAEKGSVRRFLDHVVPIDRATYDAAFTWWIHGDDNSNEKLTFSYHVV